MVNTSLPEKERACVFCGALNNTSTRSVYVSDIKSILADQATCGVVDPINTYMNNIVDHAEKVRAENPVTETTNNGSQSKKEVNTEPTFTSCMCCYHWISRRQYNAFVRLPLQNIYWYTKQIEFKCRRNYDARMMHRLARCLVMPQGRLCLQNYYANAFQPREIAMFAQVVECSVTGLHDIFARHFYDSSGKSLFIMDPKVMEAVRESTRHFY